MEEQISQEKNENNADESVDDQHSTTTDKEQLNEHNNDDVTETADETVELESGTLEEENQINELTETLKESEKQIEQLHEKLLRVHAEYENYKKRTEKEKIAERKYKSQDLATELLPVLDNFDRALETEVSPENKSFKEGMRSEEHTSELQ